MKVTLISSWKYEGSRPPLGIAYIAAVLRSAGHSVNIIDYNLINTEAQLRSEILRSNPEVVGISAMSTSYNNAKTIARISKALSRNIKVILGGAHATIMPKICLSDSNFDIIVIGEGEIIMKNLIDSLERKKSLESVRGIYFKQRRKIKFTKPQPFIEDLDSIPLPARDLVPMGYYISQIPQVPIFHPETNLITMRGCPYNCSYCQPTGDLMFGKKVRYRSVEKIVDEMEMLVEDYRLNCITLGGDSFTANRKWVLDLCKEILSRRSHTPWSIATRVNLVDGELLRVMKKAGCYLIGFGVESGSQRILDEVMNKSITIKQIKDAFYQCYKNKILTMSNLMIGSPTETKEDVIKSYELLKEIRPDILALYITNPLPGTNLYYSALKNDLIRVEDLTNINRHAKGTLKRELTDEQIDKYLRLFETTITKMELSYLSDLRRFYFTRAIIKRELLLFKHTGLKYLKNINKYINFITRRPFNLQ